LTTIYDEQRGWKRDVALSLMLHAILGGGIIAISILRLGHNGNNWGGTQQGEGTINATLVSSGPAIPLPNEQQTQDIVANDTKSIAQPEQQVKVPPPPPDTKAIELPDKTAKSKPVPQTKAQETPKPAPLAKNTPPPRPTPAYKAPTAPPKTAAYDSSRANIPMGITTAAGGGALAVSGGGDFGSKYAWYVQAVQRKVQQAWLAYETDTRTAQGRRVYLTFDIRRDGSVSNVQIAQPSGVPSLDYSAVNAMRRIDTFGPLPGDYKGSYVSVQFYFDYKR
jgi:protein TonB